MTPTATTHSPHAELPRKPAGSHTGNPGTAVASTSPWLSRYSNPATSPATPSQRGSTPVRRTTALSVTDPPEYNCSPVSPDWVLNLEADPAATVTHRGRSVDVVARPATPQERDLIYALADRTYDGYRAYRQRITDREVRVFVLERSLD